MENDGLQGYIQEEDLRQKGLSPDMATESGQRVAEFFNDVNSATLRQESVSLYQ